MRKLDFKSYQSWPKFMIDIKSALLSPGCAVVEDFDADLEKGLLQKLANSLGKISLSGIKVPGNVLENDYIHKVEVKEQPLVDKYGNIILSSTNVVFPCHTDDYFSENPVDVAILHCVIPDQQGGESIIAYLNDIIKLLDQKTLETLSKPDYPSHFGKVSILEKGKKDYSIRYNRIEIERSLQILGVELNNSQATAMDNLDKAIEKSQIIFKLKENDCLIINNKTLVHGRTAISKDSNRLLRRVRIHYERD